MGVIAERQIKQEVSEMTKQEIRDKKNLMISHMTTKEGRELIRNLSDKAIKRIMKEKEEKNWAFYREYKRAGKLITEQRHEITQKIRYLLKNKTGNYYIRYSL